MNLINFLTLDDSSGGMDYRIACRPFSYGKNVYLMLNIIYNNDCFGCSWIWYES